MIKQQDKPSSKAAKNKSLLKTENSPQKPLNQSKESSTAKLTEKHLQAKLGKQNSTQAKSKERTQEKQSLSKQTKPEEFQSSIDQKTTPQKINQTLTLMEAFARRPKQPSGQTSPAKTIKSGVQNLDKFISEKKGKTLSTQASIGPQFGQSSLIKPSLTGQQKVLNNTLEGLSIKQVEKQAPKMENAANLKPTSTNLELKPLKKISEELQVWFDMLPSLKNELRGKYFTQLKQAQGSYRTQVFELIHQNSKLSNQVQPFDDSDPYLKLLRSKLNESDTTFVDPNSTEITSLILKLLANSIDQSPKTFADMQRQIVTWLKNVLSADQLTRLDMRQFLLLNCERKAYGLLTISEQETIGIEFTLTDTNEEAFWCWELRFPNIHLPLAVQKVNSEHRLLKSQCSQILKALSKLIQLIENHKNISKISSAHAKYAKLLQKQAEDELKALERHNIENEKARIIQEKLAQVEKEAQEREQQRQLKEQAKEQERLEKERQKQIQLEAKEQERLAKEQERLDKEALKKADFAQQQAMKEQQRKEKEDVKNQERSLKEQAKEIERQVKEEQAFKFKAEREAKLERERLEREEKKRQVEIERLAKKYQQEEQLREAQEARQKAAEQKAAQEQKNFPKITSFLTNITGDKTNKTAGGPRGQQIEMTSVSQTLAGRIQSDFNQKFAETLQNRPITGSKFELGEMMRQLCQFNIQNKNQIGPQKLTDHSQQRQKLKCIIIEDSRKQFIGKNFRESSIVCARNPWLQDPAFDYDMDSEDELEEEQGEDLANSHVKNSQDGSDEEMEDMDCEEDEEVAQGFIVSDGHLSASEISFDEDDEERKEGGNLKDDFKCEIAFRKQRIQACQQKETNGPKTKEPYVYVLSNYQTSFALQNQYQIVVFSKGSANLTQLPLSLEKPSAKNANNDEKEFIEKHRIDFIKYVYASLDSRHLLIEQIHSKWFPDGSKKAIERAFQALFVKEKRLEDLRAVYYCQEQTLREIFTDNESGEINQEQLAVLNQQITELSKQRMAPLIEEQRLDEENQQVEKLERLQRKQEEKAQREAQREEEERRAKAERDEERERIRQAKETERLERERLAEIERNERRAEKEAEKEAREAQRLREIEEKQRMKEEAREQKQIMEEQAREQKRIFDEKAREQKRILEEEARNKKRIIKEQEKALKMELQAQKSNANDQKQQKTETSGKKNSLTLNKVQQQLLPAFVEQIQQQSAKKTAQSASGKQTQKQVQEGPSQTKKNNNSHNEKNAKNSTVKGAKQPKETENMSGLLNLAPATISGSKVKSAASQLGKRVSSEQASEQTNKQKSKEIFSVNQKTDKDKARKKVAADQRKSSLESKFEDEKSTAVSAIQVQNNLSKNKYTQEEFADKEAAMRSPSQINPKLKLNTLSPTKTKAVQQEKTEGLTPNKGSKAGSKGARTDLKQISEGKTTGGSAVSGSNSAQEQHTKNNSLLNFFSLREDGCKKSLK